MMKSHCLKCLIYYWDNGGFVMISFVDTNVPIAYIFSLDPLNHKSLTVFKEYDKIYWSKLVKNEYENVFKDKKRSLIMFYNDLANCLKEENFHDFSLNDLRTYVMKNYSPSKRRKQILSSLEMFWDNYVDERFPTYNFFVEAIHDCLDDLRILTYSKKEKWEDNTSLTCDRVEEYMDLKNQLKSLKVHYPDDDIVLDAHDFNLRNDFLLDFITFDMVCYEGVSQVEEFQFNKIKGKYDYL